MEVAFEPYNKVTFQSYLSYESVEAFIKVYSFTSPQGVPFQAKFFWANGILFRYFPHAPSDPLAKELLKGHLIIDHLEFAPMPKYEQEIKVPDRPMGTIVVLDVSKHAVFNPLTKWIRKNMLKE